MRKLGLVVGCLLLAAGLAWISQGVGKGQSGKLVVIVEENESYGNIAGNTAQAPYLNQLISQGELFTNYTGVADGSNPNYLGMTSGLTSAKSPPSPNIFQAIDGTRGALTWKEFMESEPGNCGNGNSPKVPGASVGLYTTDHDPGYSYQGNTTCNANDVPLNTSTFNPANLPSLSYIVPNECDDMHTLPGSGQACPAYYGSNTGSNVITMGDNWLAKVVPQLLAQSGVTVLITWDEDLTSTTPPMHVVALEAGAGVTPGSTDGTAYNHYSLEAGMYRDFGLGTAPNNGATATPLPLPGSGSSPSPTPTTSSPSPSPTTTSPSPSPTGTCSGGISVDPSSPAAVHSNYGASSLSTASFSPPAGALLEVMVDALHSGVTVTLSDSGGGTYTAGPHIQGTTQAGSIYFFQRYLPSAPGSMTVTASQSGSALATMSLAVQVLDNAAQVQTGAASATTTGSGTTQDGSLTTTQQGSWAYAVMGNGDATDAVTPLSTTSNVDVWNDSSQSGNFAAMGRSASATGTPAATNFGWTANHSDNFVWAAQEVLPGSGSCPSPTPTTSSPSPSPTTSSPSPTPTTSSPSPSPTTTSPSPSPTGTCSGGISVDPSSPAAVHSAYGASSLSTASFSPPAGALLEVMVDALHSGVTVTLSDSGGGTYTAGPHIQGTTQAGSIYFFQRYLPSAPGSMTVTASQSGSALATMSLAVQVLDNAAQVQTGAASATTTGSGTTQDGSLTTTQQGSWAYAVMGNGDATDAVTPLSTTSNVDVWNDSSQSGNFAAMGRSASATGTPAATNFGWTANHSDNFVWAAQEVLPASC